MAQQSIGIREFEQNASAAVSRGAAGDALDAGAGQHAFAGLDLFVNTEGLQR